MLSAILLAWAFVILLAVLKMGLDNLAGIFPYVSLDNS